ncbi:2OG-Fe(II) oxygenase [soil metagenome]
MSVTIDEWIEQQIARGCARDGMIDSMVKSGHRRDAAARLVDGAIARRGSRPPPAAPLSPDEAKRLAADAPNQLEAGEHRVEVLVAMVSPRVIVFGNIMSAEECDALIDASRHKMAPSLVVDPATGRYHEDKVRSSRGTHFAHGETPVVAALEQRVEALLGHEIERQEPLQILNYGELGEYLPHFDFFDPTDAGSHVPLARGGQRVATLIIYLNDVAHGGATIFPSIGFEVKPRRGNAVYFESHDDNGELDRKTLHGGAPVGGSGDKWIATKWIRERTAI